jgi:hypothetical protein
LSSTNGHRLSPIFVAEQRNATEPWPKSHAKDGRKFGDFSSKAIRFCCPNLSHLLIKHLPGFEADGDPWDRGPRDNLVAGSVAFLQTAMSSFFLMINNAILGHLILEKPYQVRLTQHARPSFAVSSALSVALDIPQRLKDVRCAGSTAEKKTEFRCRPMLWCSN